MIYGPDASNCPIKKQVLYSGKEVIDFSDDMKLFIHYQTLTKDGTVIDDSKQHKKPLELTLGHKFKLECWEQCLKTMRLGEVAKFSIEKHLLGNYATVAKQIRDYYKNQTSPNNHHHDEGANHHHCCGFMALEQGLGYKDLDRLLREPEPLDFIFELVKVLKPGEFEKETYFLTDDEKFNLIPKLRESGNALYNASDYEKACEKYGQVLQFFDELMIKEKPNDVEWKKLDEQRRPILLNFVQCKLKLGEYYSAIEHATTILNSDSTNSKALYRRAKAHVGAWNIKEAKEDFETLLKVDPSLNALVKQELNLLAQAEQEKNKQDKSNLTRLFST